MRSNVARYCAACKARWRWKNHLRRLAAETGYDREILLRQIGAQRSRPRRSGLGRFVPVPGRLRMRRAQPECTLLTLLSQGRIPAQIVDPGDFDEGPLRECAAWLIEGKSVNAFFGTAGRRGAGKTNAGAELSAPAGQPRGGAENGGGQFKTPSATRGGPAKSSAFRRRAATADAEERRRIYEKIEKLY